MKDTLTDANFPRTADQRVYHLGLRAGEVANRIVTVGSPSRAHTLASFLDAQPKPFILSSERGFLTITGRYKGVPVSIVSIGMGSPNMDFFIREARECVDGDMAIIRFGSCGALIDVPVGTVVVPQASIAITRNVDFDFARPDQCNEPAYRISKPALADSALSEGVRKALEATRPPTSGLLSGTLNASADSFYSSQGRQTSFPDHNSDLTQHLLSSTENLATLEMETFHLYHLAACWAGRVNMSNKNLSTSLTTRPASPITLQASGPTIPVHPAPLPLPHSIIRAAAVHMVFASRTSQDFITPHQVEEVEHWTAKGILDALANTDISDDRVHADLGSVWDLDTSLAST